MKLRRLVAMAASVAVLTAVIAAPVSAGGPASVKIGARGVQDHVYTLATNCPEGWPEALAAAARTPAARTGVDATLKSKTATRAKSVEATTHTEMPCGEQTEAAREQDYYAINAVTAEWAFGQAGSGHEFTGTEALGPVTFIFGFYFEWNGTDWDVIPIIGDDGQPLAVDADVLLFGEDLAFGGSSTYIPGIGQLDVGPCVAVGAWGRGSTVDTGGIDPGRGWTHEDSWSHRACYLPDPFDVSLNGNPAVDPLIDLARTTFTQVDVYPY